MMKNRSQIDKMERDISVRLKGEEVQPRMKDQIKGRKEEWIRPKKSKGVD